MSDETLSNDEITWTAELEQKMLDLWNSRPSNPPSLKELTVHLFREGLDGRSQEAQAIKRALARHSFKAKTTTEYDKKSDKIEISLAHKQYIENYAATMTSVEMARVIFANPKLSNLDAETRAVNNYLKSLTARSVYNSAQMNDVPSGDYEPPRTMEETHKRINQYIEYVPDRSTMNAGQKKCVEQLMKYLGIFRFVAQMNNYETNNDRKLCEDAFIRSTHDKPDLLQEEIDQYIEYANQVVQGSNIQKRSLKMQTTLETITGNDPDTMKVSMGLVEAIGKASTEYTACKKREQDLLDSLKQKRSARLAKQLNENASILNLVQAWKEEETRVEMLRHAKKEQEMIANEVDRLSSLPDFKARILGLNKEGIRNG